MFVGLSILKVEILLLGPSELFYIKIFFYILNKTYDYSYINILVLDLCFVKKNKNNPRDFCRIIC